jgi:hypothetical protein
MESSPDFCGLIHSSDLSLAAAQIEVTNAFWDGCRRGDGRGAESRGLPAVNSEVSASEIFSMRVDGTPAPDWKRFAHRSFHAHVIVHGLSPCGFTGDMRLAAAQITIDSSRRRHQINAPIHATVRMIPNTIVATRHGTPRTSRRSRPVGTAAAGPEPTS